MGARDCKSYCSCASPFPSIPLGAAEQLLKKAHTLHDASLFQRRFPAQRAEASSLGRHQSSKSWTILMSRRSRSCSLLAAGQGGLARRKHNPCRAGTRWRLLDRGGATSFWGEEPGLAPVWRVQWLVEDSGSPPWLAPRSGVEGHRTVEGFRIVLWSQWV